MNRPARPAPVQFYFDADVLGLAKIFVQIRGDVTYPGDPGGKVKGGRVRAACPITDAATPDHVWIPETALQGWLIITRDRHIQEHRAEIAAVKSSSARLVTLAGAEAVNTFNQMEALMCNWRQIQRLLVRPGPFIFTVTRTTMRQLPV